MATLDDERLVQALQILADGVRRMSEALQVYLDATKNKPPPDLTGLNEFIESCERGKTCDCGDVECSVPTHAGYGNRLFARRYGSMDVG